MSVKTEVARRKLEAIVDQLNAPPEYRATLMAAVTQAYIMGLSDGVVAHHGTVVLKPPPIGG